MTSLETPSEWLIQEYESINPAWIPDPDDVMDDYDTYPARGSVVVQPMFTFKSDMELCPPMQVTASDYLDKGRWWL